MSSDLSFDGETVILCREIHLLMFVNGAGVGVYQKIIIR